MNRPGSLLCSCFLKEVVLGCTNSTENRFNGAIEEDVAERNGAQQDAEEGANQVQISIFRLRQQEKFICDLRRFIEGRGPESPELERPQAVHHYKTKRRRDTQRDKVARAGRGEEKQANATDGAQEFKDGQRGNAARALTADWFHTFLFSQGGQFTSYIYSIWSLIVKQMQANLKEMNVEKMREALRYTNKRQETGTLATS